METVPTRSLDQQPSAADGATAGERSLLRTVALPTEHGGWSLTLEPALLALLVAWSWPGLALGAAAMAAFLGRTPLKVVLVDRWRGRTLPRTRVAARVAAVEIAVVAVLLVVAALGADGRFWIPLAVAVPLLAVELWFDMRSRSRRLIPELAGTVGIGSVAAAIALADGADSELAVGLWCVVASRAIASIPYARTQVMRRHGRLGNRWHSDLAQLVVLVAAGVAWGLGVLPAAAAVVLFAVVLLDLVAVRLPAPPAPVVGVQQVCVGLAVVVVAAIAFV